METAEEKYLDEMTVCLPVGMWKYTLESECFLYPRISAILQKIAKGFIMQRASGGNVVEQPLCPRHRKLAPFPN